MGWNPAQGIQDYTETQQREFFKRKADSESMRQADQTFANETNKAMDAVGGGANAQLQNNRLNTSNPFASVTFGPDGSVSQQFSGGLGVAANGLQGQAAGLANPMDWNQFGALGNGDDARNQAITAAYGQATSRLDPQWDQRMEAQRTQLLNQGLDPSSEAYKNAMRDANFARNDAYSSAMNGAIAQGTAAGDSAFRNNMSARQQAIVEAMKRRSQPLDELGQLQGFLSGQPTYNQDNSSLASGIAKSGLLMQNMQGYENRRQQDFQNEMQMRGMGNQQAAGAAQGAMSDLAGLAGLALMFSDERLKADVVRHPWSVVPGVPAASWTWRHSGARGHGVIAQDLAAVRPDLVHVHPTGFLMVDYAGLED